jgi:hypothetical protein
MIASHTATAGTGERLYREVAGYAGVPAAILYAMAQAESGQLTDGRVRPWPWTLNIAGTPKRYPDRDALFRGLMAALGSGERMIDIGPMQVNWYWHFDRLGSPWRITDPAVNLKIAAQILKTHYARSGDWWDAVGRYHRPAESPRDRRIAARYRQRVRHFYEQAHPTQVADHAG